MTHQQMLNMGFNLISFSVNNQQYSFDNLCFIPKIGIYKVRRKQILLLIYQAGLKQGYTTGKNERKIRKRTKPFNGTLRLHASNNY